ncbi:tail fiber assembly protein [Escherichia coli]|uniref:tail fiber assembly protein n=1 Tax=Escherichia coli TaxID=562 RepID=UPI0037DD42CF
MSDTEEYDGEDLTEVSQDVYNQFICRFRKLKSWLPVIWPCVAGCAGADTGRTDAGGRVERQRRIYDANDFMNSKQWPGKAAIGRLKGEELAQYNLWLDYLDALELVDTASAPDIEWPTPPAVQAR